MTGPSLALIVVAATDGFPNMSWAILDEGSVVVCAGIAIPDEDGWISTSDVDFAALKAEDDVTITDLGVVIPDPVIDAMKSGLFIGEPDTADILGKLGC